VRIQVSNPRVALLVVVVAIGGGLSFWVTRRTIGGQPLPFGLGTPDISVPFLAAAGGTTLLWLGMIGGARVINQPRRPKSGQPTQDLGPEPPALAAMLAGGFDVPRESVTATLFDLAARGAVEIVETGNEDYAVRVKGEPKGGLLGFEHQVLILLRQRAVDGVVPAAALTTGRKDISKGWWKTFRGQVVQAAQARGLSRDLWDWRTTTGLTAAGVIPALLWWPAVGEWQASLVAGFVELSLLGWLQNNRRQRDTPAGLDAGSRWLGVQRWIREAAFEDLPPTAVTIWERHMAYAAAFGAARTAIRAFPMGADEDHAAWTPRPDGWQRVRISYPWVWPPGWGARPELAALAGFGLMAMSFFPLRIASVIGWPTTLTTMPELASFLRFLTLVFLAVGLIAAFGGMIAFVAGLTDLGSHREVKGLVLRVRTFGKRPRNYVAVDDGRSRRIRAWRLRATAMSGGIAEYRQARAVVTRTLRNVRSIEPVE